MDVDDKEWFYGYSVDEPPCEQRYAPHRFAAVLFVAGLVVALLLGCASAAPAVKIPVMVYDDKEGGLIAQFYDEPCKDPSLVERIRLGYQDKVKHATSSFRYLSGKWKDYGACWLDLSPRQDAILLLTDDGDHYVLPKAEFLRKVPKGADT